MAIILLSVFLIVGTGLLRMLLSIESGDRDHQNLVKTTARLARLFRSDVHQARHADLVSDSADALALALPDGRVLVYESDRGTLRRTEFFESLPLSVRDFDLLGRSARFSVDLDAKPGLVGLSYDRRRTARQEDPRPVLIDAALGLDLRFRSPAPEARP